MTETPCGSDGGASSKRHERALSRQVAKMPTALPTGANDVQSVGTGTSNTLYEGPAHSRLCTWVCFVPSVRCVCVAFSWPRTKRKWQASGGFPLLLKPGWCLRGLVVRRHAWSCGAVGFSVVHFLLRGSPRAVIRWSWAV